MCSTNPCMNIHFGFTSKWILFRWLPRIFIGNWVEVCYSCSLTRVAADSVLRMTRVSAVGYELRWFSPAANSSFGRWIRVTADTILRLTRVPAAGLDLWQAYTLIYRVNLRNHSAKYIIFMVYFLGADFSYHWFRLWLLLQEPWRSLKKLEEAWRSFKTLGSTDSSCSGGSELPQLIRDLRSVDYLQNFGSDAPWYICESKNINKVLSQTLTLTSKNLINKI